MHAFPFVVRCVRSEDHTVQWAIANSSYKHQQANPAVTEIIEIRGRGHAFTIDGGWREVADRHWCRGTPIGARLSSAVSVSRAQARTRESGASELARLRKGRR